MLIKYHDNIYRSAFSKHLYYHVAYMCSYTCRIYVVSIIILYIYIFEFTKTDDADECTRVTDTLGFHGTLTSCANSWLTFTKFIVSNKPWEKKSCSFESLCPLVLYSKAVYLTFFPSIYTDDCDVGLKKYFMAAILPGMDPSDQLAVQMYIFLGFLLT